MHYPTEDSGYILNYNWIGYLPIYLECDNREEEGSSGSESFFDLFEDE